MKSVFTTVYKVGKTDFTVSKIDFTVGKTGITVGKTDLLYDLSVASEAVEEH